jgi:hypothetical protein
MKEKYQTINTKIIKPEEQNNDQKRKKNLIIYKENTNTLNERKKLTNITFTEN